MATQNAYFKVGNEIMVNVVVGDKVVGVVDWDG
jgi:putative methionine-R-sulfoxide reductase with GAF domain